MGRSLGLAYVPRDPRACLARQSVARTGVGFVAEMAARQVELPGSVKRAMDRFIGCGDLERGFVRVRCTDCRLERLVPFSCKVRGLCASCGAKRMAQQSAHLVDRVFPDIPLRQWVLSVPFALRPMLSLDRELQSRCLGIFVDEIFGLYRGRPSDEVGAVSVIQRFGNALNLHAHFHVLAMDGRWREDASGVLRFQDLPPKLGDIDSVSQRVADRIIALLRRWGRLEDEHLEWMDAPTWPSPVVDGEAGWLVGEDLVGEDQPLVAPSSATPVGTPDSAWVAQTHGFSVHAGISIEGFDVRGRERLCRYVTRPPYADAQLTETRDGRIAYKLAKPKRTGETHVFFTPHQLVRRLTSQIPPPGQNLLRYHGVLGPAARRRKEVVRSAPPSRAHRQDGDSEGLNEKAATWATLLHRVYEIDVLDCPDCGGRLRIVSAIEDPPVIRKILSHLGVASSPPPESRSPEVFVVYEAGAG